MVRTTEHHEGALDHTKVVADGAHRGHRDKGRTSQGRLGALVSCIPEILKGDESVLYLCLCFFSVGMYFRYTLDTQRVDREAHTTPSLERECSAFLNSEMERPVDLLLKPYFILLLLELGSLGLLRRRLGSRRLDR